MRLPVGTRASVFVFGRTVQKNTTLILRYRNLQIPSSPSLPRVGCSQVWGLLRSWLRVAAANNFCNILIHRFMVGVPAASVAGTFFLWEKRHGSTLRLLAASYKTLCLSGFARVFCSIALRERQGANAFPARRVLVMELSPSSARVARFAWGYGNNAPPELWEHFARGMLSV